MKEPINYAGVPDEILFPYAYCMAAEIILQ